LGFSRAHVASEWTALAACLVTACKPHVASSRVCVLLPLFAASLAALLAALRRSRKLLETHQRRRAHACGCALRVGARLAGPGALPLQGSAQICNGGCCVGEWDGVVNGRFSESESPAGDGWDELVSDWYR
jgi:hypothetical protein